VASELAERAKTAMADLPDDYRAVLRLAVDEQLPLRVVAQRMGRSREAVKKLYGRALARFTSAMESREEGRNE